jgi:hypothetical protein
LNPSQIRHPERSAAQICRITNALRRAVEDPVPSVAEGTPAMLVGRCSSELSNHNLQSNIEKSQPPAGAYPDFLPHCTGQSHVCALRESIQTDRVSPSELKERRALCRRETENSRSKVGVSFKPPGRGCGLSGASTVCVRARVKWASTGAGLNRRTETAHEANAVSPRIWLGDRCGHSRLEKVFDRHGNLPGEVCHRRGNNRLIAERRLLVQLAYTPRSELRNAGSH